MPELVPFALFGVVLVVGGLVAYLGWKAAKERREALAALAAQRGWTWVDRDDSWAERFSGDPFGEGSDRKAHNVLTGTYEGLPMAAFDYSYETYTTDSKGHRTTHVHRYSVCALRLPSWLPTVELTPENLFTRVAGTLGLGDVELESEDFNRRFRVSASDPKLAYDVLHPRTMEALLARPAVGLRIGGEDAVVWEDGTHSIVEMDQRLETLHLLVAGIPSFVWKDRGGTS